MDEALAILLLPARLEDVAFAGHARGLLEIPRVIALEPSRRRTPNFMRDGVAARQATRIKLPGTLRVVVIYDPAQYPLARAFCAVHGDAELWYFAPAQQDGDTTAEEMREFDAAARARAATTVEVSGDAPIDDQPLRLRLRELDVISGRAFIPAARFQRSFRRAKRGSS
jgi:hypothetical protein